MKSLKGGYGHAPAPCPLKAPPTTRRPHQSRLGAQPRNTIRNCLLKAAIGLSSFAAEQSKCLFKRHSHTSFCTPPTVMAAEVGKPSMEKRKRTHLRPGWTSRMGRPRPSNGPSRLNWQCRAGWAPRGRSRHAEKRQAERIKTAMNRVDVGMKDLPRHGQEQSRPLQWFNRFRDVCGSLYLR